jgi:integrase/recombinase XerD
MQDWLGERGNGPDTPLFPHRRRTKLSRDAIEHRIAHYTTLAVDVCPSLRGKTITAHVLRHTTAMRLLHAGVDTSVIALWLGHVSIDTTRSTYTPTLN